MAPATAVAFLLLGLVLLVRRWRPDARATRTINWLFAGFVIALGTIVFAEFLIKSLTSLNPDIEQLLVRETRHPRGFTQGRMSPMTAVLMMLLAVSVAVSFQAGGNRNRRWIVAQAAAAAVSLIAAILLVGYLYSEPLLYNGDFPPVALTTAFGFLISGTAVLLDDRRGWMAQWFSSTSVAARFTRLNIPFAVTVIVLLGWFHQRSQLVSHPLEYSLVAMLTAAVITLQIIFVARNIQSSVVAGGQLLRERQKFAEGLIESLRDGLSVIGPDGRRMMINQAMSDITGLSREELMSATPPFSYWPEEHQEEIMLAFEAMTRGEMVETELVFQRKDGERFPVLLTPSPLNDDEGNLIATSVSIRDITDSKRAEMILRESEEKFRTLFDNSTDGIFILDMQGRFLDVNHTAFERLGYSKEEMLAMSVSELDPPEFAARVPERIAQIKEHGYAMFESAHVRKDGSVMPVEVNSRVIDYRGEKALFSVIRDISERKSAEKEQEQLREQLGQAQKMESVGRLAGGVAHDFNNMLGVIMGHVELAKMNLDPSDRVFSDLEEIHKAARRSADLTRQLLAFARKQDTVPQVLALDEAVAVMLGMLQRLIGEEIDLEWHPAEGLWPIKIDPSQVDQMLANLVVNARDAIDDGGKITITLRNETVDASKAAQYAGLNAGDYVVLSVIDDGRGMDEATLDKIFEPFFTTKGMADGTGLGLSTVYGIVKQNDGYVHVESSKGQGSIFEIYLPRYQGPLQVSAPRETSEPLIGNGQLILLVEDEATVLKMVDTMLQRLGYTVIAASTAEKALSLARERGDEIKLLLTDVIMPKMSGRELQEELAALVPGISCLYMSGYTDDVISSQGVLGEGVFFIQKPFTAESLALKVHEALGQD
ncbi:MAG: PAS domain-containing hybrid sensor histidine kinase/response regulator [Thermoleophilia bacterium]